ncbi:MAG TPA: hypothetical protein VEI95_00300 [Acidobacteriota bacterium]|nr:hypothetical protein [Acidobacteriota bacterium]
MSRTKKILFVVSFLISAEFFSLPFITQGTFSWTTQHNPSRLKAAAHADANTVELASPAKTDGRSVLEMSDELSPRSGGFLTAKANAEFRFSGSTAMPHRFRTHFAPKVSRYITKSVLNI